MSRKLNDADLVIEDALAWNDHMGRLLQHADRLLAEWEAAAQKAPDTLRESVKPAIAAVQRELIDSFRRGIEAQLAEVRAELARTQRPAPAAAATAGPPARVTTGLLLVAIAGIALCAVGVFWPKEPIIVTTAAPAPAPVAVITPDARPAPSLPADAAAPASVPTPNPGCNALLRGVVGPSAKDLVFACAAILCPPPRHHDDAALKRCEGGGELVVRLRALHVDTLTCKPEGDVAAGYDVSPRWLDRCLGH
jgi:hypothetical protein